MSAVAWAPLDWSDQGPSFKRDVMCVALAIALHAPLYFMKFDAHKKVFDRPTKSLVQIDLLDQIPVAPPPPAPVAKEKSLMDKLKMLVRKEPPPPPPKKVEPKLPDKLDAGPKTIKLEPKLNLPDVKKTNLADKGKLTTAKNPKLIEESQIKINTAQTGLIAPLSEKKLGTVTDRGNLNNRGNFSVAKADNLQSIGAEKGGRAIDTSAPVIAIRTGSKGSVEKFSAPPPQKADKGKMGSVGVAGLGDTKGMSLRDQILSRDAAPAQIDLSKRGGSSAGVAGGVPGGVEGGVVGGKRDMGRYQGGQAGGIPGGLGTASARNVVANVKPIAPVAKPKPKRDMFTITGPLKDRKIEKQVLPDYPDWAIAQNIEASVIIEFVVEASGYVKDALVVRRTSGYPLLDKAAMQSLRKWKFVALPEGEYREEVGQITFNFSLN